MVNFLCLKLYPLKELVSHLRVVIRARAKKTSNSLHLSTRPLSQKITFKLNSFLPITLFHIWFLVFKPKKSSWKWSTRNSDQWTELDSFPCLTHLWHWFLEIQKGSFLLFKSQAPIQWSFYLQLQSCSN